MSSPESEGAARQRLGFRKRYSACVLGCLLSLASTDGRGGPAPAPGDPLGFFTNVAARLLQSELGVDLNRIQLYPTNQYTPSVHRLLQVTANLLDATTNRLSTDYPYLPSAFRPLFTNDSGTVYIFGYAEETGTNLLAAPLRDLTSAADRAALQPTDMVYGVPVVLGARQGLPNFNKFALHTQVEVRRRLEFNRAQANDPLPSQTNQMYVVGISNVLGAEAWNSYSNTFPRDLQMIVAADLTTTLSNENATILVSNRCSIGVDLPVPACTWTGFLSPYQARVSFQLPLLTNATVLANSTYSQALGQFVPPTDVFESGLGFPAPRWWLNVGTRLRFMLVDTSAGRIVDYVNLVSRDVPLDLTATLMQGGQCGSPYSPDGGDGSEWCTNRWPNGIDDSLPTGGILNQIGVGLGLITPASWNSFVLEGPAGQDRGQVIDFFRAQFGYSPIYNPTTTYYPSNTFLAPFTPLRNIYLFTSWQANDPLVHYTVDELTDLRNTNNVAFDPSFSPITNLGRINRRYDPWGGSPVINSSFATKYNLALKDPLIWRSDSWGFPTNLLLIAGGLGRVHRGTPWQTIYLKATGVDAGLWQQWVGVGDDREAQLLQATNDWEVARLLSSLFNTNDAHNLMSVNQTSLPAWAAALNGIVVLTNTVSDTQLLANPFIPPQFDALVMQSNSPQATLLAAAIDTARSNRPGQFFPGLGDVLVTPELSVASPWLNWSSAVQLQRGISDDAYESIPSQLLGLLRPDSIGLASQAGGTLRLQFTGLDGYAYAVQVSSNLLDWAAVSTNYPSNGSFKFIETKPPATVPWFYRTLLLP